MNQGREQGKAIPVNIEGFACSAAGKASDGPLRSDEVLDFD